MNVNWEAVSAIGTWVGGIATFAAVVVALCTSRQATKIKIKVSAGIGFVPQDGELVPAHMVYSAYNNGLRPVHLTDIGVVLPNGQQVCLSMDAEGKRPAYVKDLLPAYLNQSDAVQIAVPIGEFVKALINNGCKTQTSLKTFWADASGKQYFTEMDFDPQEFFRTDIGGVVGD